MVRIVVGPAVLFLLSHLSLSLFLVKSTMLVSSYFYFFKYHEAPSPSISIGCSVEAVATMIGCFPTQAIAFGWKPGFTAYLLFMREWTEHPSFSCRSRRPLFVAVGDKLRCRTKRTNDGEPLGNRIEFPRTIAAFD